MYYLVTYTPICFEGTDIPAIQIYNQPKYADSSIRREPELESDYVGISSICRAEKFAPKLNVGDIIIYLTKKGIFDGLPNRHRKLVAILKVIKKCRNHEEASQWFKERNIKIPTNCIVDGNEPLRDCYTGKHNKGEVEYQDRVKKIQIT